MFTLADNQKIGKYLKERIEERFDSHRKFCKEYLKDIGKLTDNVQIQKMSNRLSQILNGKKGIQLSDLPVFCRLLEVSCESILSAGESCVPASARLTNYAIAFSKEEREWEDYVARKDSPVLNADEYGKTVIDYALEAGNYDFLRYLMEQNYIWFVGPDEKKYFVGFGAGTSIIEKNNFPYPRNMHILDVQLKMRDELRTNMIALAIHHEDLEMLEQLHAREIPSLYQMCFYSTEPEDCKKYYNRKLMEALVCASDTVLDYFSKEFEIKDRLGRKNRFLFPFIGELMEQLLQNKNSFVEYMLKNAVEHNQYVYDEMVSRLAETIQSALELYYDIKNEAVKRGVTEGILRDLRFFENGSLISYFSYFIIRKNSKGMMSNLVRVDADSTEIRIHRRILELNELYDAIHNITPKWEGEE